MVRVAVLKVPRIVTLTVLPVNILDCKHRMDMYSTKAAITMVSISVDIHY